MEGKNASCAASDHLAIRLLKEAGRRSRCSWCLLAAYKTAVECRPIQFHSIEERFVSEEHCERDDGNAELTSSLQWNICCAVDEDLYCHGLAIPYLKVEVRVSLSRYDIRIEWLSTLYNLDFLCREPFFDILRHLGGRFR